MLPAAAISSRSESFIASSISSSVRSDESACSIKGSSPAARFIALELQLIPLLYFPLGLARAVRSNLGLDATSIDPVVDVTDVGEAG